MNNEQWGNSVSNQKENEVLNFVFTGDASYLDQLEIVIKSILVQHRKNVIFHWIVGLTISAESTAEHPIDDRQVILDKLDYLQQKLSLFQNATILLYYARENRRSKISFKRNHLNDAVFLRFDIPLLNLKGRILYLDLDLLILKPVDKLFTLDMKGTSLAMASETIWHPQPNIQADLQFLLPNHYANAGVILIDLDNLRKKEYDWDYLYNSYPENCFLYYDQDFLNYHYREDRLNISQDYNCNGINRVFSDIEYYCIKKWNKLVNYNIADQDYYIPSIIHWNSCKKPWKENTRLKDIWNYYENLTFEQIIELDSELNNREIIRICREYEKQNFKILMPDPVSYMVALNKLKPVLNISFAVKKRFSYELVTETTWSYKIPSGEIIRDCSQELDHLRAFFDGKVNAGTLSWQVILEILYIVKQGKQKYNTYKIGTKFFSIFLFKMFSR